MPTKNILILTVPGKLKPLEIPEERWQSLAMNSKTDTPVTKDATTRNDAHFVFSKLILTLPVP